MLHYLYIILFIILNLYFIVYILYFIVYILNIIYYILYIVLCIYIYVCARLMYVYIYNEFSLYECISQLSMRIWFFDLFLSFMHHYSCACVYRCRSMEAGRYHQLLFSLSVVEQCSKSRNVINREVLDDSNSRARSEYNWLVVDRKMME